MPDFGIYRQGWKNPEPSRQSPSIASGESGRAREALSRLHNVRFSVKGWWGCVMLVGKGSHGEEGMGVQAET